MTYLVCFVKYDNYGELIVDTQYHVFDKCLNRLEFIHDELFKAFSDKAHESNAQNDRNNYTLRPNSLDHN